MRLRIKPFLLWALVMILLSFLLTPVESAAAANEPMVVVAYDNTQGCYHRVVVNANTANATTVTYPCAPGSVISSKLVKLSDAVANKEKYVVLPPQPWSNSTVEKLHNDIVEIINSKSEAIKAKASTTPKVSNVHPNTSCGGHIDDYSYFTAGYSNNTIGVHLSYDNGTDCVSVYLDYITLTNDYDGDGSNIGWDHNSYSYSTWNVGCKELGYNVEYDLNSSQSLGSNFEPWVASQPECGIFLNKEDIYVS